jgi:hypothetical protein
MALWIGAMDRRYGSALRIGAVDRRYRSINAEDEQSAEKGNVAGFPGVVSGHIQENGGSPSADFESTCAPNPFFEPSLLCGPSAPATRT